jgi:Arc/MetJ-type ribon-helix-helix transcriptional regulator
LADMEKITINITPVDLGRIDMLVEEGFYQNRSDFIRAAIRRELDGHDAALATKAGRFKTWETGVVRLGRGDLEAMARDNIKDDLYGLGSLIIEPDVPSSLVDWVFGRIRWYGTIEAGPQVKAVIAGKSR